MGHVINVDDLDYQPWGHGTEFPGADKADEKFEARIAFVGPRIGAQKLGYNITVVPPGKRAFPLHNHRVNEEMFFVLEGTGEVRIGDARHPIKQGDIIACPPGGTESAHQIVNTGSGELRYLSVSSRESPEVVDYPETGRFGMLVRETGADGKESVTRFVGRLDASLPYWQGE